MRGVAVEVRREDDTQRGTADEELGSRTGRQDVWRPLPLRRTQHPERRSPSDLAVSAYRDTDAMSSRGVLHIVWIWWTRWRQSLPLEVGGPSREIGGPRQDAGDLATRSPSTGGAGTNS